MGHSPGERLQEPLQRCDGEDQRGWTRESERGGSRQAWSDLRLPSGGSAVRGDWRTWWRWCKVVGGEGFEDARPEGLEVASQLNEPVGGQRVDAAAALGAHGDQARVLEDAEVLRDSGLRDAQGDGQLTHGVGAGAQSLHQFAPCAIGEGVERRCISHSLYIRPNMPVRQGWLRHSVLRCPFPRHPRPIASSAVPRTSRIDTGPRRPRDRVIVHRLRTQ